MKNILFVKIHSFIDVITNSSTELFVGKELSKQAMIDMIENIYPNYRNEYGKVKRTSELTNEDLLTFLSYSYEYWSNKKQEMVFDVVEGFEFDDMYARYKFGDKWTNFHIREDFVKENREKIIKSIDPNDEYFFLFSLSDNPDWEMQEKLMDIMDRYHLG